MARAARIAGSAASSSSVHDVVAAAARWMPVGRPSRRAERTAAHAGSRSGGSTTERVGTGGRGARRGCASAPRAPRIHARTSSASTTASTMPWSSAVAASCEAPATDRPVVCSTTRGPAKPTMAPASAMRRSVSDPYDANTPPVVGLRCTEIESRPAARWRPTAAAVRESWISESMPSCIRAPPERVTTTTGSAWAVARSNARTTFSPCTRPIEPPIASKSHSTRAKPSARPVRTDSPSRAAALAA
ncbi:MAG: hypothetical protein R2711_08160 [Acidimicrobiales bacterium]